MDTPILDGVLGDRLQQARADVDRAEAASRAFTAALTAGQAEALDHLASTRAERLVGARTALLSARVSALEAEVRTLQDQAVRAAAAAHAQASAATGAEPPAEAQAGAEPHADAQADTGGATPAVGVVPAVAAPLAGGDPTTSGGPGGAPPTAAPPTTAPPTAAPPTTALPPTPLPTAAPAPVPAAVTRPARKGADQGPTGEDVPTVPSMKDIFASSRAAGWLDSLLGAKR